MMKTKIYCLLGLLVVGSVRADTGASSKYYVDSELAQKEALIPAKSVDTLLTYPKTGGDAVERQIKSTLDNSTIDTSVVTAGAANDKIETRQDAVQSFSPDYVLAYSDTDGFVYPYPIQNSTYLNYFGSSGLVTAQTLNDSVVGVVNNELTQVDEEGNETATGALWRLNTISYAKSRAQMMLNMSITATGSSKVDRCDTPITVNVSTTYTAPYVINGQFKATSFISTTAPAIDKPGYVFTGELGCKLVSSGGVDISTKRAKGKYCYCRFRTGTCPSDKWVYLESYTSEVPATTCNTKCRGLIYYGTNKPIFDTMAALCIPAA